MLYLHNEFKLSFCKQDKTKDSITESKSSSDDNNKKKNIYIKAMKGRKIQEEMKKSS